MKADLLIIGSGVAAAAIVRRVLAARPKTTILVLEAGGKVKMRDFAVHQNYLATGTLPYQNFYDYPPPERGKAGENRFTGDIAMTLATSRLMMFGGTTVHWDGYSFRFKPEDFRLFSNTGQGIDWPIDYSDLEPYYCAAESFVGVSGDSQDATVPRTRGFPFPAFPYSLEDSLAISAFERQGISYSHLPIARQGIASSDSPRAPCQTTGTCMYCPFGAVYNAANDFDELLNRPTLTVRANVVVERLLMDGKARARGVEFFDKSSGERGVAQAGTVIVAAGTVESPKLLQRSISDDWKQGVGNDHDLVGRNIVTHPWITYTAQLPSNPLRLQSEMDFPTLVSRHYDNLQEQPHGKFIIVNPPVLPNLNLAQAMQQGKSRAEIDRMVSGPTQIQLNAMFEVFSQHEYRVTNLDKLSHLGMPESLVHFESTPIIRERLKTLKVVIEGLFKSMGTKGGVSAEPSWGAHHATCTTRMSASPELGVVDSNMKIHGVDNVFVCSNASFSTLSSINPTLTLVALSLRLGDHLLARLNACAS